MSTTTRFAGKQSWKEFSDQELEIIKQEREVAKQKGPIQMLSDKEYGLICRACTKPNNLNQHFCTGCGFEIDKQWDLQQLPDNVFLEIIHGKNDTKVLYRDDHFLVFDDKFGVSQNHLDIIPVQVIKDVTFLNKEHIPMLQQMFKLGLQELKSRPNVQEHFDTQRLEEFVVSGYNFPVSVKHLHLHMVLPPFKHKKVFQYPRWHSHAKIINDLETHGRVITFEESPNDEEGAQEYRRAMDLDDAKLK